MDSFDLFQKLLLAEDELEVQRILERAGYPLGNEAVWRPLGDTENNFQTVGNQQSEATAALVEKIINGIDAVLLGECPSHLAMRGAPLKSVQELLGHGTIEMTMRYSHLSPDARRDAVKLLDVKERLTIVWRTSKGDVLRFPLDPPLKCAA
jgi:hypothetical protein